MILKKATVLVVDDDSDVLTAVRLLLKPEAGEVIIERNPENINQLLQRNQVDILLLDMNFNSAINTGNEGLYWLRKIKALKPGLLVIMITAYGEIDLAVRCLKEGADDFVVKPWHNEKLIETIKELLDKKGAAKLTKQPVTIATTTAILGASDMMQDVFYKVSKIAPTDANILILGENGTGKDLMAKAIHEQSLRAHKPFVKVDVGALTDTLFESELFGHKKGAFTDAREDRQGRLEAAEGGTLFLDEIGNITLQQQAKLLTVLQNRQVTRLGTNKSVDIDIRLICATNVPLQDLANESRFRKDLIYRINTVEITMPPLRKRNNDVVLLAKHFADVYAKKYLKPAIDFEPSALQKLKAYHYPGNIRELQYSIERAVIMADASLLRADDIIFSALETAVKVDLENEENLLLSKVERSAILRVIEKHNGNITRAAKELGLTRTALYRRLNKYEI
ncbi:DNA-binding NtrC family response regulator [Mucilaginibacter yixingensis]|uniref:DNA-binding NtrC family response regulator n=1 Tax=Mucilaginibacter yixingensis TaxID=1295612 RepID=A0A2T5JGI0_9SPHI|nr:sigma-54 dependent transcriptional regulator [Mucilaginibacter yixingensis]PTR01528.1 DNA-binding NtrC family response regulator [Mucilaginibacter yixingensis]